MSAAIDPAVLPSRGFLPSYVEYASALTDAPPIYHLAVGLSMLSAAAGNRIRTHAWGTDLFPHLWSVLVAPSSYFRKTTSISIGMRLLHEAAPGAILPNDFSRERFLDQLQSQPAGVIQVGEFGGLLAVLGREYMGGTKEQLTELYDAPTRWERVLQSKKVTICEPAVSILSASTIDWLQKRISEGDVRGGFLPRFLFWPATDKLEWRGLVTHRNDVGQRELTGVLARLAKLESKLTIATDAQTAFDAWLRRHEEEHVPPDLQGFHSRLETAALKLAMIYQLSADVPKGILPAGLHVDSVGYGTALAELLWANTKALTERGLATATRYGRDIERVEELIGNNGGIDRRDLLRRSHLRLDELGPIVRTLQESGLIEEAATPSKGGTRVTYRRLREGDSSGDSRKPVTDRRRDRSDR